MPNATPIAAPPKHRWYQYSLRTLFVIMTLLCVLLGMVFKLIVIPAERQRAAVDKITQLGGSVIHSFIPDDESWIRKSLREILPRDYFDSVIVVMICRQSELGESDLECLEALPLLRYISLNGTSVAKSGLLHLKGLSQLKRLKLNDTSVTDADLRSLSGLVKLEWLELIYTKVTDAGLKHLSGLTSLVDLRLDATGVTDAGMDDLNKLAQLQILGLASTEISDAGLDRLTRCSQLTMLNLFKTKATDAGVERFQQSHPNCTIERLRDENPRVRRYAEQAIEAINK